MALSIDDEAVLECMLARAQHFDALTWLRLAQVSHRCQEAVRAHRAAYKCTDLLSGRQLLKRWGWRAGDRPAGIEVHNTDAAGIAAYMNLWQVRINVQHSSWQIERGHLAEVRWTDELHTLEVGMSSGHELTIGETAASLAQLRCLTVLGAAGSRLNAGLMTRLRTLDLLPSRDRKRRDPRTSWISLPASIRTLCVQLGQQVARYQGGEMGASAMPGRWHAPSVAALRKLRSLNLRGWNLETSRGQAGVEAQGGEPFDVWVRWCSTIRSLALRCGGDGMCRGYPRRLCKQLASAGCQPSVCHMQVPRGWLTRYIRDRRVDEDEGTPRYGGLRLFQHLRKLSVTTVSVAGGLSGEEAAERLEEQLRVVLSESGMPGLRWRAAGQRVAGWRAKGHARRDVELQPPDGCCYQVEYKPLSDALAAGSRSEQRSQCSFSVEAWRNLRVDVQVETYVAVTAVSDFDGGSHVVYFTPAAGVRVLHVHPSNLHDDDAASNNEFGAPRTLGWLRGLATLRKLYVRGCHYMSDISGLPTCTNLRVLHLRDCHDLEDLGQLARCAALEELLLSCNAADIAPLAECPNLRILRLHGCHHIRDLEPIQRCLKLTRLQLRGCMEVRDLRPLVRHGGALDALHVVHCAGLRRRGSTMEPALVQLLQLRIRSVRIEYHGGEATACLSTSRHALTGVVYHTKRVIRRVGEDGPEPARLVCTADGWATWVMEVGGGARGQPGPPGGPDGEERLSQRHAYRTIAVRYDDYWADAPLMRENMPRVPTPHALECTLAMLRQVCSGIEGAADLQWRSQSTYPETEYRNREDGVLHRRYECVIGAHMADVAEAVRGEPYLFSITGEGVGVHLRLCRGRYGRRRHWLVHNPPFRQWLHSMWVRVRDARDAGASRMARDTPLGCSAGAAGSKDSTFGTRTAPVVIRFLGAEGFEVEVCHPAGDCCAIEIWLDDVIAWGVYPAAWYGLLKTALCAIGADERGGDGPWVPTLGDMRAMYSVSGGQLHALLADTEGVIGAIPHQADGYDPPSAALHGFFARFPPRATADLWRTWVVCTIGTPRGHVDRLHGVYPFAEPPPVSSGRWPTIPTILPVDRPRLRHRWGVLPLSMISQPEKFGMRVAIPYWEHSQPAAVRRHGGLNAAGMAVGGGGRG